MITSNMKSFINMGRKGPQSSVRAVVIMRGFNTTNNNSKNEETAPKFGDFTQKVEEAS